MDTKITRFVDVAVPLPIRRALTYRLPAGIPGCHEPGARALVPVGRRLMTGVILRAVDEPAHPATKLKDIVELPDQAPLLPPEIVSLAVWAARYYVAGVGRMLAAVTPPGIDRVSDVVVSLGPAGPDAARALPGRLVKILSRIPAGAGVSLRKFGLSARDLKVMEEAGLVRARTIVRSARVRRKYRTVLHAVDGSIARSQRPGARAIRQRAVLELVERAGTRGMPIEDIQDRLGPSRAAIQALVRKGCVRAERQALRRRPQLLRPAGPDKRPEATPAQRAVLAPILASLDSSSGRPFLLMGVTGSGKTEVYLRAIERCIATGRTAIYLVPEITLTPLLARDLRSRLGDDLAILHSSLRPGERFDEWQRALTGQAKIVLGARSAILSPLSRVGLIIVDEEQDASYKQGEDPRYNARDLALLRGRQARATVILGSATPSTESFHAARTGRLELLELPDRILSRPMARVRVIDMRERFERTGREELVAAPLQEAVRERLSRGEQAIILLNRRGYAPFVLCRSCGTGELCRHCSVVLTYHRAGNRLRCHYCGYWRGRPSTCSTCGSSKITFTGAGTQKLEERMEELFPEARLVRLDRDTARGRRAAADILSSFEKGEFNLLVGTQMVAKGHDFPGVTIVGVVGADNLLALPEFRAAERTFQLITQVAGRAGRGTEPGEVIVQVFHRDHYAIQAAVKQDFQMFYEKESRFRRIMRYPPYAAMAKLIVQAKSPESGVRRVRKVAAVVRQKVGSSMTVIGPSVAPIARLKGRYRYQLLVKAPSKRRLSDVLNEAADALGGGVGSSSSGNLIIDVDPISLA
ncbi:MAG: primosomal protein N' [Acidobacteriota bacterium]